MGTTDTQRTDVGALVDQLETAKHNVRWLLDHAHGSVDMHGLEYWAGRVASLRNELSRAL